jgi:NADP-dependent 3-hydroxy acid dehydrogenase YdfG
VNLLGLMYCTHAALPVMKEQESGHIVNVSSVAGRVARMGSGVYNATKFGVGAFSESLRQEGVDHGVRVTIIEPGFVATELQAHNEHPMVVKMIEKNMQEIGKVLEAGDIANAIVYAVQQPEHVSINEVLVRPTKQRG